MVKIEESWKKIIKYEFKKDYMSELKIFLSEELDDKIIYPRGDNIFRSFNLTPFPKVKIVILGQDPYHQPGQANGLCFSVNKGINIPPSLLNIFKELKKDLNIPISEHGDLTSWAKQGVLLLNSVLTVERNLPNSHKNKGWEIFTDSIISSLDQRKKDPVVFLLWGNSSKKKIKLIKNKKHIILTASHPSPFSASTGFFGCKHFSLANKYLNSFNMKEINWQL